MTTMIHGGSDTVLRRALRALEEQRAKRVPLLLPSVSAVFFILLIIGACFSELVSATIGFNAALPQRSDGTGLAGDMMSLRYSIVFCLLAGDILLNSVPNRVKALLDGVVHSIGAGAVLIVLFGVGAFMACATFLTLGSDGEQGFASHFLGVALGIASAVMFCVSFLANHAMIGKLVKTLPVIADGLRDRAQIASGDKVVGELEVGQVRIDGLRQTIAEMEKLDALRWTAANEAGVIVGMVASEVHDMVASRKVRGDRALEPQDISEVPDVPLDALEQRYNDLKQYTASYFFNLLKRKEA